jgi:hypothetical protein
MHLLRSPQQSELLRQRGESNALERDYQMDAHEVSHSTKQRGDRMLTLIQHLRDTPGPTLFATTAHLDLILSDADPQLQGRVIITPENNAYRIAYDLPPDRAPWPQAQVVGYAADVVQATNMLLKALEQTRHFARA